MNIDEMHFSFMPGCGITNAIFYLETVTEEKFSKVENLYFAFADWEIDFDHMLRDVVR